MKHFKKTISMFLAVILFVTCFPAIPISAGYGSTNTKVMVEGGAKLNFMKYDSKNLFVLY